MGKVIFISGLRRSGTTILSDILTEFKEIKLFYEPFGNNHAPVGGGSGLKKIDVYKNTRVAKESFLKKHDNISIDYLNRGAPKNHILEIENKKLDDIETSFLRSIIHGSNQVPLLKFTRATFLTPQLYNIAKNALFLHVIREPRSWVSAHLTCSNKNHKILKIQSCFLRRIVVLIGGVWRILQTISLRLIITPYGKNQAITNYYIYGIILIRKFKKRQNAL